MINNELADISPLRVAILSDSAVQRAALKRVLKSQGSQIVHEDSLGAYHPNDLAEPTDVLLIDLKNAGDLSLQKLDELLDDNRLPVLFNDGETIPTDDGPARDDWINNLTNKLFTLANRPVYKVPKINKLLLNMSKVTKLDPSVSGTANILLKKDFPRTTIISISKTRRNVLQNVLLHQGLTTVHTRSFSDTNIEKMKKETDILLLDQHNVGVENYKTFEALKKQKTIGYIICDSSKLPIGSKDRQILGAKLIQKLTSKASLLCLNKPDATPNALYQGSQYEVTPVTPRQDAHKKAGNIAAIKSNNQTVTQVDVATQTTTKVQMEPIEIPKAPLFKQDPAHWADRLSDALAGVRRNLRAIERNKISLKGDKNPITEKNKDLKNKIIPLLIKTNENAQVIIKPVIKKTVQSAPIKMATSSQNIKNNTIGNTINNTTAKNSDADNNNRASPAILDIFSDMVEAVKHVPSESNSSASLFLDSSDFDITNKSIENDTIRLSEKTPLQNWGANKKQTTKKKTKLVELSNNQSADFEFSNELLANNNLLGEADDREFEFNAELCALKDELNIFDNDKDDLSMFVNNSGKEKGRRLLGIDWSNPFK